jgi:hypothetical protein
MSEQQEAIQNLRIAASQRQWNLCCETVGQLLPYLSRSDTLHILLNLSRNFLANLFHSLPQDEKISDLIRLLDNIPSYEAFSTQGQLIDVALESKYTYPGINNYRHALRKVAQLTQLNYLSEAYIETWIDILSGILMGTLAHAWGSQNPELWQEWFHRETRESAFILAKFSSNPETIALDESLWNQVADDIEVAIRAA